MYPVIVMTLKLDTGDQITFIETGIKDFFKQLNIKQIKYFFQEIFICNQI